MSAERVRTAVLYVASIPVALIFSFVAGYAAIIAANALPQWIVDP